MSNPLPANDQRRFQSLIGTFATGVTVVTTSGVDGPAGMTASAVAALSLKPLLVMVGFDLTSRTLATIRQSRRFAINVLASDQEHVSRIFASKGTGVDKFAACAHADHSAVPILEGTLAWLRCDVVTVYPGGDHVILVGNVVEMGGGGGDPLLFFAGRYWTLGAVAAPPQRRARRASEHSDRRFRRLPATPKDPAPGVSNAIKAIKSHLRWVGRIGPRQMRCWDGTLAAKS